MINKIIFFPFTHITRDQLNIILAFFPSFHYFPASRDFKDNQTLFKLFEKGIIHPFFSSGKELDPVEQKLEEYLAWAGIHKGNEVNLKLLLKQAPYFTSDTYVTAIKSQIKGFKGDKKVSLPGKTAMQHDLLFLKMAKLCDAQNERIDLELKNVDKTRDELVSTLRGLESPLSGTKGSKACDQRDPGAVMTRERIFAWSGCMAGKPGPVEKGAPPLFVTTSEAVFDHLESNCKDVVNTLDIDKIKVHENECENKSRWQHHFCEYLMRAVQGDRNLENDLPEVNDACSFSGQIKLNLFSGNDIARLFNMPGGQVAVCLIKLTATGRPGISPEFAHNKT
ncbi:MAG: hypothetical protein GXP56_11100 [Deltaproteobacteria bacterium]|nr:hypothetical protein [Deltaproteobacteria bacterium]